MSVDQELMMWGVLYVGEISGELTEYSEFVKVPPQQSWALWTFSLLVKSPLLWSMQKMKDALISPTFPMESKYVHLGAAKTYGEELIKQLNDHQTIKLVDLQNVFDIVKEKKWSNENVLIAIHWLRHQGVVSVLEQPDLLESPLLIKVNKKGQTGISEVDMAVYSLWSNETILLKHIEQLETERTAALNEARSYLSKGTRNMAKTSLRKKHELENIIEKKVLTLENVRILLNQLNDSDLDAQVLESYKKGASVLKAVLKDSGLTEESVSTTMLQLEESSQLASGEVRVQSVALFTQLVCAQLLSWYEVLVGGIGWGRHKQNGAQVLDVNQEIQAILSQPIGISTDKDLEEELATLLESSGSSGPSDNTHYTGLPSESLKLPDVPTQDPTIAIPLLH
uniref:Charged multivesicular body protein 7 n=1 Tax=Timema cristinae TaxID=61476 RepID=A0A7R9CVI6_TIMCR|nr:unnamed protein product [Timema cristinae]